MLQRQVSSRSDLDNLQSTQTQAGKRTRTDASGLASEATCVAESACSNRSVVTQERMSDWVPSSLLGAMGLDEPQPRGASQNGGTQGVIHRKGDMAGQGTPGEVFGAAASGPAAEIPFKQEMESAFGEDFSSVKAHLGQGSAMASIGAHAATQGETVAFGTNSPNKELVAHELTHVVQNRRDGTQEVAGKSQLSSPGDASEKEADLVASKVASGERVSMRGGSGRGEMGHSCECSGAGCAACGNATSKEPSGPVSGVARAVVYRAVAESASHADSAQAKGAVDQAVALLRGPARQVAQNKGSAASTAERTLAVDQMLARLTAATSGPAAGNDASGEEQQPSSLQLLALVQQLQSGFANAASLATPRGTANEEEESGSPPPAVSAQTVKDGVGEGKEGKHQGSSTGGMIQRQTAPPPFDCNSLLQEIIEFINVLKQRSAELIADAQGLQWNHWGVGDAHPTYGSVEGHQDQFRGRQRGLRRRLNDWNSNNCGGGPPLLPADAWDWATRPAPSPTPRPNPAVQRTVEVVATGVGVGAGLYVAYRVIRFLPSLFPPLWWTIPANAVAP